MYTKVYTAPESIISSINIPIKIFLAGAIDMGKAKDWQSEAIDYIERYCVKNCNGSLTHCVFNPRRKNWDSSWEQSIENPQFYQQVNWELDCLEKSSHIIMCLTKDSKAPISLLELGLFAHTKKVLVVCDKEFYRKGNVDIVCSRFNIPQYGSLELAVKEIFKN